MNRIPATHAGSLIRPPELLSFLAAEQHGQDRDSAASPTAGSRGVPSSAGSGGSSLKMMIYVGGNNSAQI
jgi:hypothetical protein